MNRQKVILLCGVLFMATYGFSQTAQIKGIISDSKTGESLPLASVFINNTTISTASNVSGQYILKNIPEGPIEVVVSYIGYESSRTKLTVRVADSLVVNFKLIPSTVELPNVQIKAKRDKDWAKQYQKFERVFLGENSTGAKIINPGVIDFAELDKGNILVASASEAIEIENPGLGYRVFYYLSNYQSDKKTYIIVGDTRFEEMKKTDNTNVTQWIQNRKEIYSGSLRHLLVSLINNKASEQGFQFYVDVPGSNVNARLAVFSMNKDVIPFSANTVFPGSKKNNFKVQFPQRVEVHYVNKIAKTRTYKDVPGLVGWIDPTHGFVEVNAQGIVVGTTTFVTSGYLSEARIASLLPDDYKP